jgi:nucleotide-binding universal stress UspA family protein
MMPGTPFHSVGEREEAMILPIQKILCPTDFSEPSYEGLKVANELAVYFSAELILVHVISSVQVLSVTTAELIPQVIKELEQSAKQNLEKILQEKIAKGIRVRTMIIEGGAAEEIVKTARHESVDWIVIATHGQSGWKKFIFGSVAERVVRLADRPVLIIQPPVPEE